MGSATASVTAADFAAGPAAGCCADCSASRVPPVRVSRAGAAFDSCSCSLPEASAVAVTTADVLAVELAKLM